MHYDWPEATILPTSDTHTAMYEVLVIFSDRKRTPEDEDPTKFPWVVRRYTQETMFIEYRYPATYKSEEADQKFHREGYHKAVMAEIAKRCGVGHLERLQAHYLLGVEHFGYLKTELSETTEKP